ncbi:Asp-tRNA(Asn)/Glu-tRNA(Gln) amidotransferase subunit GatC [Clostridium sp. SYSU_GA19001]|uniref:Asp-tRNA(Asn)/Glu-tRNA(Gln) amidotransferase subunit GatC n=1 Tax=Clostridium caldaquaticum TaxID=2940653 RepID=UPI00207745F3|nr:Asp-tRNA(Asn)/Glu-tRNA(Gln) amidotransferase subunit GatC [Clostridium caldaquaticum]MCM8711429.1 Asp-tRNA(Asn)/Glu-tRNA(Gln) amidotransferase subunit GatC [Clostridium caldaquaticum]
MKISIDEVNYIAKLAKLKFTEEEAEKMAEEFEGILNHFESIDKFDLSDVQLDIYSEDLMPHLRKDVTSVFEDKKKLYQNVKSMTNTCIKVPKIIE